MKRSTAFLQTAGFIFTSVAGTFLHFLYGITGDSLLVTPFSAVNESTWEHMKLIFFPMFIFAITESRYFKEKKSFWCIKAIGILSGLVLIPVLFYTYNGAFGNSPDFVNIGIFFISAAISFILETMLFENSSFSCTSPELAFIILCAVGVLFVIFTFYTPTLPLFRDTLTGTYGVL